MYTREKHEYGKSLSDTNFHKEQVQKKENRTSAAHTYLVTRPFLNADYLVVLTLTLLIIQLLPVIQKTIILRMENR
jgi:hypothetical protein